MAVLTRLALAPTLAVVRDIVTGTVPVTFDVEGIGAKAKVRNDAAGHDGHSMPGMDVD
ncbi:hypothetical protein [Lichenihabitans psoromatis]|uniref:hypothetical protein n=1 Tax=Lichenihabitans psoromatis TaxID=2528642 RepID=UPI0013F160CD|nr:hypothetical protein [Lichenihabitans psoromatis]